MALSEQRREELAAARQAGLVEMSAMLETAFHDHQGDWLWCLAYYSGTIRQIDPETGHTPPFNYRLTDLQEKLKDDGRSWPDIAEAMGMEGASRDRTCRRRFEQRIKLRDQHRALPGSEDPDA